MGKLESSLRGSIISITREGTMEQENMLGQINYNKLSIREKLYNWTDILNVTDKIYL